MRAHGSSWPGVRWWGLGSDSTLALRSVTSAPALGMNYLKLMDDKYRPRSFEELCSDPIPTTLLNEPVRETVELRPGAKRSLHAVLVESLTNTKALLSRLEAGVHVARNEQREVIRLLYVATRHQVKALAAVLELDGLE